jgi:hypothetical protein
MKLTIKKLEKVLVTQKQPLALSDSDRLKFRNDNNHTKTFNENYFSELNPIFIFQLTEVHKKHKKTHYLIRDGIVPITQYFYHNPVPHKKHDFILILPYISRFFIPRDWIDKIYFYENDTKLTPKGKTEFNIISGPFLDSVINEELTISNLKEIKNKNDFNSFSLCEVNLNGKIWTEGKDGAILNFTQELSRLFKNKLKFDSKYIHNKFANDHFNNSYFYNIAEPTFIYDNFLFHFYSKRDAYFNMACEDLCPHKEVLSLDLSFNHCQKLYTTEQLNEEIGVYFNTIHHQYTKMKYQQLNDDFLHKLLKL